MLYFINAFPNTTAQSVAPLLTSAASSFPKIDEKPGGRIDLFNFLPFDFEILVRIWGLHRQHTLVH